MTEYGSKAREIIDDHGMVFPKWYVVEVSFRPTNPIHRAIAQYNGHGVVDLHASYEGIETARISSLAYFRVVSAIDDMNAESYPNRFKLPTKEE